MTSEQWTAKDIASGGDGSISDAIPALVLRDRATLQ